MAKHIHKWKIKTIVKPTQKYFGLENQSCKCGAARQVQKDIDNTTRVIIGYLDDDF
jgi:hypothetical protein